MASFVGGYQLTCSCFLRTTLQIIALYKKEITALVLLPVSYPLNDPSVASQMIQSSIKLHKDIGHQQICNECQYFTFNVKTDPI